MQLFEAILDANHRALAGDERAGLRPDDFAASLPVAVLTCYDPRMHPLMPEVLGVPEADFIWITNAGNVVTGPLGGTAQSLALACAVHDAKEIAVIGHTDCRFFQMNQQRLLDRLQSRGLNTGSAAGRLEAFLGRLVNERTNVMAAVRSLRDSFLIPRDVPIHGLMVDIESGQLDWVTNGYAAVLAMTELHQQPLPPPGAPAESDFRIGDNLPPIGST